MALSSKKSKKRTIPWNAIFFLNVCLIAGLFYLRPKKTPAMASAGAVVEEKLPVVEPRPVETRPVVRDEVAETGAVHQAVPQDHPFFLLDDPALEDKWDEEVKKYLLEADPEGSAKLIYDYEELRADYRSPLAATLSEGFKALDDINGSEHLKMKSTERPVHVHAEHFTALKWTLGPHYPELEEQRRHFLLTHQVTGSSAP